MREIQKGRQPGQYWPTKAIDGVMSVTIYCPECKEPMSLENHTITPDGAVGPSVICPHPKQVECPKCKFHDEVKLVNWQNV